MRLVRDLKALTPVLPDRPSNKGEEKCTLINPMAGKGSRRVALPWKPGPPGHRRLCVPIVSPTFRSRRPRKIVAGTRGPASLVSKCWKLTHTVATAGVLWPRNDHLCFFSLGGLDSACVLLSLRKRLLPVSTAGDAAFALFLDGFPFVERGGWAAGTVGALGVLEAAVSVVTDLVSFGAAIDATELAAVLPRESMDETDDSPSERDEEVEPGPTEAAGSAGTGGTNSSFRMLEGLIGCGLVKWVLLEDGG